MVKIGKVKDNVEAVKGGDCFTLKFKNAGTETLSVNGTTPVVFTLEDLSDGQGVAVSSIAMIVVVGADITLTNFGNLAGLTNGLEINIGGTVINLKNNADLFLFSTFSSVETVTTLVQAISINIDLKALFGNSGMNVASKETLKITVRDNLSTLSFGRAVASGVLVSSN